MIKGVAGWLGWSWTSDRAHAAADGYVALNWAARAHELGGSADRIAVAGWSAGGDVAAVVAQTARDAGGPELRGQLLVTPVTDGSRQHASRHDNATTTSSRSRLWSGSGITLLPRPTAGIRRLRRCSRHRSRSNRLPW